MSLARTALRLAVIEALNADPVIDGLCAGRVFDSRIGDMTAAEAVPVLVVYTEDDSGDAWSANNGGPGFDQKCDLLIEIAVRASVDDEPGMIGIVESDQELEAVIDLIEHQVVEAITVAPTPQSRLVRTDVTRRVTGYKSMRFVSDETTAKLAIRMLHLATELKGSEEDDGVTEVEGEYALLPEPLRTVARFLPDDAAGKATCDLILSRMVGTPIVPFEGADITLAPRIQVAGETPAANDPDHETFGFSAEPDHA